MLGFEGPFEFEVDDRGTEVPWDNLAKPISEVLAREAGANRENSSVYICTVAARRIDSPSQKNHAWEKVKRVIVQAKSGYKSVRFLGIYPREKRVSELPQSILPFYVPDTKLSIANVVTLELSNNAKNCLREDRYVLMTSSQSGFAQWAYHHGWDQTDFNGHVYIVTPRDTPTEKRYIDIDVVALLKKNKPLGTIRIVKKRVSLS